MQSINDRRLTELNAQVQSLEARQAEQQSTVEQLRRELEQAREQDLNAEAKALQSGSAHAEGRRRLKGLGLSAPCKPQSMTWR